MTTFRIAALAALLAFSPVAAAPVPSAADQLGSDGYTRYELLAPGSGKFRILYDVTADTPGAAAYFNPIRKGSRVSDERVTDLATGKPLRFAIVDGAAARAGGVADADAAGEYLKVTLTRRVPANGGEGRILIDKTYEDAASYFMQGETIVFERSLGIKRNAVVLPAGYELVTCNTPAQVLQQADGRIAVSFWETSAAATPLRLTARPARGLGTAKAGPLAPRLAERATQTREIVYFLQPPETHAFDLYHDYTETKAGVDHYVNVVRAGSSVTNPSAIDLDSGAKLAFRIVRGRDVLAADPKAEDVTPDTQAVVFDFPAVRAGGSVRLRFSETYTDPARYRLEGDELVWDRSFGRPANAIVLPAGWALTNSAMPAIASRLPDGRMRLDFLNPRPDELGVLVTARRVTPGR